MKELYKKISIKKFVNLSILCCVSGDILILFFVYHKFKDLKFIKYTLLFENELFNLNAPLVSDPHFFNELSLVTLNILMTILILFVFFHLFVYSLFYYRKKMATEYIMLLSWCAAITCTLIFPFEFRHSIIFSVALFLQAILYSFVALGFIFLDIPKLTDIKKQETKN